MHGVLEQSNDTIQIHPSPKVRQCWTIRPGLRRVMVGAIAFMALSAALVVGGRMRQWTWVHTEEIRFTPNINNAYFWGMRVNRDALVKGETRRSTWREFFATYRIIYDREWNSPSLRGMVLDYAPLRLLTVALWARTVEVPPEGERSFKSIAQSFIGGGPPSGVWRWEDVQPIVGFNSFCAAAAAVGAFFLVRYWARRQQTRDGLLGDGSWWSRSRPWIYGWIAGLLLWLNPAVMVDGHGWPQWDIWCVPFYIWAAYAASVGMWFVAGALLLVGILFKAQLTLAAPVLLIWAIFAGGITPLLRLILGFAIAAVVLTSIWLLPTAAAWCWAMGVIVAAAVGLVMLCRSKKLRPRLAIYLGAAAVVVGVVSGFFMFHGSLSWLYVAFYSPTEGHPALSMGAANFPAILEMRYQWGLWDPVWNGTIPWTSIQAPIMRDVLRGVYVVGLVLCGIAAAVQARRGSARVLLALTAPWVLLYAVMPQLHERHILWAAAITAIGVGVSLDLAWLHLLVTALAVASILGQMCSMRSGFAPSLTKFLNGLKPDVGWVILVVALIYLFQALKFDRRGKRPISAGEESTRQ